MLLHNIFDKDGSRCMLTMDEANGWIRATWRGFIDSDEATRGAEHYLISVAPHHCPYLLNDNLDLVGPWFDSVEWLAQVWLPQAEVLGLRYVAHVVQSNGHADILTQNMSQALVGKVEVQLFHDLPAAEYWLRSCQLRNHASCATPPAPLA